MPMALGDNAYGCCKNNGKQTFFSLLLGRVKRRTDYYTGAAALSTYNMNVVAKMESGMDMTHYIIWQY